MSLVGNLEDLGLGDILQIVSLSRKSGVLNLAWGEVKGKIIFKDGQVVASTSTLGRRSLVSLLSEHGALANAKSAEAEGKVGSAKDAAAARKILSENYGISPDLIDEGIREQIEATIFHFFTWPEGTFSFELQEIVEELNALKPPDHAFVIEPGLSPQFLAMEGTRLQDERKREKNGSPVGPPVSRAGKAAPEIMPPAPPAAAAESAEPEPPPPEPASEEAPRSEEVEEDFSSVAEAVAYYEAQSKGGVDHKESESIKEKEMMEPPTEDVAPEPSRDRTAPASPASDAEERAVPEKRRVKTSSEDGAPDLVILDDDHFTIKSITHHLAGKGLRIRGFDHVDSYLSYMRDLVAMGLKPRATLIDLIMPNAENTSTLGGLEAMSEIRSINPAIPVYMMTDYENQPARAKAEDLGVRFFFTKPKSSQLDEDFGSPELLNFVQVLESALESAAGARDASPRADEEGLVNLGDELRREFGEEIKPDEHPDLDAVTPSRGLHMLKSMISELNDPSANGQITLLILRFASELMNRAVIFLVAKNQLAGLGQFGLEIPDVDPQKHVRQIRIPLNQPSIFREAIQKRMPLKKSLKSTAVNDYLVDILGGHNPQEVFVAPIIAGGRIAAIIYGDNAPAEREIGDTESLEIFLAQAGLAMEKALLERRLREMEGPGEG